MAKIITMLTALFLAAPVGAAESAGGAASYSIRADGLNCNFCVYTVEKLISRVDGVERKSIDVDLKTGLITLQAKPGAYASVESLRQAVGKSGFSYRWMDVDLTGRLMGKEGAWEFQPLNGSERYALKTKAEPGALKSGQSVRVRGRVSIEKDQQALSVETIEPVSEGKK